MFKFQSQWECAEKAFVRFSNRYYEDHVGESFDERHLDAEWEKLGIMTPCRRCGVTLDRFNGEAVFDSWEILFPMFKSYRANGEMDGQRPRFYSDVDVGISGFCESCCHDLVPWFQKLADVLGVNKVVSYLERSIRCQRNNNPVEKSKLLDNLGKCL